MTCPHLEFRDAFGDQAFEGDRPFCGAAERFVQPMRADICRERYGLAPREDCEIFRRHEGLDG